MGNKDEEILKAAHEAELLGKFRTFCDKLENDPEIYHTVFNIMYRSSDKERTICQIFKNRLHVDLGEDDAPYMLDLVNAFFRKSSDRKPIPLDMRLELIKKQEGRCVFCGALINEHDPVDHIVPFKYVGDELEDNYQILCTACNSKKNDSIDFQIKVLLNLGYKEA